MKLRIRRYLTASEFVSDLSRLRAFRGGGVGNTLLESLERLGLLRPRVRLFWPDPVARRFWRERHSSVKFLHEEVEPDGVRWDAATRLHNSLNQLDHNRIWKETLHPFDDPEPDLTQFIQTTNDQDFVPYLDRRVSVAHDSREEHYDSGNIKDFYNGWQVLAAAEAADMGVHIRTNMSDARVVDCVRVAIREGKLPVGHMFELFDPSRAVIGFRENETALDAVIWFVEEGDIALSRVLRNGERKLRVNLTDEQEWIYREARADAALSGMQRYGVGSCEVIKACQFLAGRWANWVSEDRPSISSAYRIYLAAAVGLLQTITDMSFESIRDAVGHQGTFSKPILDTVWPDWAVGQKERVVRTLRGMIIEDGPGALSLDEIVAFSDFLEIEYQDAIFLRLESFERHAFGEVGAPINGMKSDIQGMAVAVEHAVRSMGGTKPQLFQMFCQLWTDPDVSKLLTRHKTLAEKKRKPSEWTSEWTSIKAKIESLRSDGPEEAVAADLIMAHRLRGAVHYVLPEEDQFELEKLFVCLLRAVAMTHAHTKR